MAPTEAIETFPSPTWQLVAPNQNVLGAGLWLATVRSSLDDQVDWNQQRDAVSNLFLLGEAVAHLATAKMEARRR